MQLQGPAFNMNVDVDEVVERGWWSLDITGVDVIDDLTADHIGKLIKEGYTNGQIVQYRPSDSIQSPDEEVTESGWWYLNTTGVDEIDDLTADHIARCLKAGYTDGEIVHCKLPLPEWD